MAVAATHGGSRWSAVGFKLLMFNDMVVVGGRPPIKKLADKYPHLFGGHGASLTSKLKDISKRDVGSVSVGGGTLGRRGTGRA